MERDELAEQLVGTWRRHNEILLFLVRSVPARGFAAVPLAYPERQGPWGKWIFGKQARLVLERVRHAIYQFNSDAVIVIGPHVSLM